LPLTLGDDMRSKVLLMLFAVAAFAGFPPAAQADTAVTMQEKSFIPKDVIVGVGDSVVWTNADTVAHSVTADDGSFDSSPDCGGYGAGPCIQTGQTFKVTFSTAGRFLYHCRVHGGKDGAGMSGTVNVLPVPVPLPSPGH
jgi:plastocyanin